MDDYLSTIEHRVNARSFKIKNASTYPGIQWNRKIENLKSSVIAKAEHMFLIVKRYFGYRKTVYRGISKNMIRFNILFTGSNLLMCARAGRTKEFCSCTG